MNPMAMNPAIGGIPPGVLGPGLDFNQVLLGFQQLLAQQQQEKPTGNLARQYIRDSGAFTIKPLEEGVKVSDGREGEADYWAALGYTA